MQFISDIGKFFGTLQTADLVGGLIITGAILVIVADWRLALLALAAQYILVASLMTTLVPSPIAIMRVLAGALAAAILYITARRTVPDTRGMSPEERAAVSPLFLIGWPFRAVALVMVGVSAIALTGATNLLGVPALFWLVSLWLMGSGLLIVALTRDVIRFGLGLLTFDAGFGALYLAIDSGLAVFGALIAADLLIALAVAHLAGTPLAKPTRRRRGEF